MDSPPDGVVYLGFAEDTSLDSLTAWMKDSDPAPMLAAMNRLPVQVGEAVLVPAWVPHAIGAGILLVELQEPTDSSIMLEWQGFAVDDPDDWHLGLGPDTALALVDRSGWPAERLAAVRRFTPGPDRTALLPAVADDFFRAELITDGAVLSDAISVLVGIENSLQLQGDDGVPVTIDRGDTYLLPYAAGPLRVSGTGRAIRCLPPAADRPAGAGTEPTPS